MADENELRAGLQSILKEFGFQQDGGSSKGAKKNQKNEGGKPKQQQKQDAGNKKAASDKNKKFEQPRKSEGAKPQHNGQKQHKPANDKSDRPFDGNKKPFSQQSDAKGNHNVKQNDSRQHSSQHQQPPVKQDKVASGAGAAVASTKPAPHAGGGGGLSGRIGLGSGEPWYKLPQTTVTYATTAVSNAPPPSKKQRKDGNSNSSNSTGINSAVAGRAPSPAEVTALRTAAAEALAAEVAAYESRRSRDHSADAKWARTVMTSGTASDRLAALTLAVSDSPLHSLKHLDGLLALAGKAVRRESSSAVEALKDLFLNNLLPSDRKLIPLSSRPPLTSQPPPSQEALALWAFEDGLKVRYASLVAVLSRHLTDSLPHFKTAALGSVADLLTEKPEGEAALLGLLVNKLGDPDGKVASKAGLCLSTLTERHPAMKPVIAREVTQFLLRPGLSTPATYHGLLALNQLPLSRTPAGAALAGDLIATYFMVFEAAGRKAAGDSKKDRRFKRLHKAKAKARAQEGAAAGAVGSAGGGGVDGGVGAASALLDSRLLSAILTGVNRAFPYAVYAAAGDANSSSSDAAAAAAGRAAQTAALGRIEARADAIFTAVHAGSFNTAVQALMLLLQLVTARLELAQGKAPGSSSAAEAGGGGEGAPAPYLPGQGPASAATSAVPAAAAATSASSTSASAGLSDSFVDRFYRALYSVITLPHLGHTSKHALFLNLAFKACGRDPHTGRVRATVKRLVQVALHLPPSFAAGTIFLVSQLCAARPELRTAVTSPAASDSQSQQQREEALVALGHGSGQDAAAAGAADDDGANKVSAYDPFKREPRYAGAEGSCLWELSPLALHYHPSVRRFADAVLTSPSVPLTSSYGGDPLADFSLMAFLDRIVYKNPKKKAVQQAATAAAAAAGAAASSGGLDELQLGYAIVQGADPDAIRALASGLTHGRSAMQRKGARHGRVEVEEPATAPGFAAADPSSVRPEDAFLHSFFRSRALAQAEAEAKRKHGAKKGAEGEDADMGDVSDADEAASDVSDAEVDAFADRLAMGLMRSANNGGGGAGETGDDDPLDDWMLEGPQDDGDGDGDDDGGDSGNEEEDEEEEDDDGSELDFDEEGDDEEDGEEGSDGDGDSDRELGMSSKKRISAAAATATADDDEDGEGGSDDGGSHSDDDSLLGGGPSKAAGSSSSSSGGGKGKKGASAGPLIAGSKRPRPASSSVFADADDYADALADNGSGGEEEEDGYDDGRYSDDGDEDDGDVGGLGGGDSDDDDGGGARKQRKPFMKGKHRGGHGGAWRGRGGGGGGQRHNNSRGGAGRGKRR